MPTLNGSGNRRIRRHECQVPLRKPGFHGQCLRGDDLRIRFSELNRECRLRPPRTIGRLYFVTLLLRLAHTFVDRLLELLESFLPAEVIVFHLSEL
jgi:hypothetical protein